MHALLLGSSLLMAAVSGWVLHLGAPQIGLPGLAVAAASTANYAAYDGTFNTFSAVDMAVAWLCVVWVFWVTIVEQRWLCAWLISLQMTAYGSRKALGLDMNSQLVVHALGHAAMLVYGWGLKAN